MADEESTSTSILNDTKKILGINDDYPAFDLDIITHINSTFSLLNQLGIGPSDGFVVNDVSEVWTDIGVPVKQERMIRTYLYLKVRMLFDPPTTSFLIEAMNKQIEEHEHRLSWFREELVPYPVEEV